MNNQQKEQKELLKLQKLGYAYLARDKDNDLYAYRTKPSKHLDVWAENNDSLIQIGSIAVNKKLFTSIKFYNPEAKLIEDLLVTEPESVVSFLQRLINKKYNYLVSDKDGIIRAFKNKPKKYSSKGEWSDNNILTIELKIAEYKKELSDKVKWTNTRPTLIEDLIHQFNTLDNSLKMTIFSNIDAICESGIWYIDDIDNNACVHISGEDIRFDNNNLYVKNDKMDIKIPFTTYEVLWFLTKKDFEKTLNKE